MKYCSAGADVLLYVKATPTTCFISNLCLNHILCVKICVDSRGPFDWHWLSLISTRTGNWSLHVYHIYAHNTCSETDQLCCLGPTTKKKANHLGKCKRKPESIELKSQRGHFAFEKKGKKKKNRFRASCHDICITFYSKIAFVEKYIHERIIQEEMYINVLYINVYIYDTLIYISLDIYKCIMLLKCKTPLAEVPRETEIPGTCKWTTLCCK